MHKGISLLGIAFLFLIGLFWWNLNLSPVNPNDHSEIEFNISPGSGLKIISNDLKRHNLIKNTLIFTLMVQQSGLDKKIQAGSFSLSPSLSGKDIALRLTKGAEDIWITIPEGKRAEEIAEVLKVKIPDYQDSWEEELTRHEGYLFPDTYLIPKKATIKNIIELFTSNFEKKYETISIGKTPLSKNQIVILASLIEREARHDQDRPLISSVLYNRLEINMPLQIDATVQYTLGRTGRWWKKDLTFSDLKVDSTYNTYIHTGLPPSAISNPGLKSLQAAANPDSTSYLYYMTDKNGVNHYALTNDQHNANIHKYGL